MMDATFDTTAQPEMPQQPTSTLSMGRVVLIVNDLDKVRTFYETAVGLHLLRREGESAELGAGSDVLLELRSDRSARRRTPREAGLFHVAFLLPTRGDLARWTRNAIERQTQVVGISDHLVSEAIYLTDPEGNGVEIYADRPSSQWLRQDGMIAMPTEPLDVGDLLTAAQGDPWRGFPEGAKVGHVHLQVGELPAAEAFYAGILGLDVTNRYPGAVFYAADGYHHHVATNIWNSRGASRREFPSTGLAEVEIRLTAASAEAVRQRAGETAAGHFMLTDPWGTPISILETGAFPAKDENHAR